MEGKRVKSIYEELAFQYGISWKSRNYNKNEWTLADNINRAISSANAGLYALCTAVICSMGFIPQLGFVHSSGTLPFVFDIADLYKAQTSFPAAFMAISVEPKAGTQRVITILKDFIEKQRLIKRIPEDLKELMK